ncbi:hypothetical protein [Flavobacterium sp.]|uniref:hypothetical protein n=1 Tax=Flavobacterium sp. TaxID=239 RepID=UPI00326389BD
MKNSTLMDFRDYIVVEGNSFKVDFSRASRSEEFQSPLKKTSEKKTKLSGYLMLGLLFLFTNFLFAQQPACNLNGLLETKRAIDGGRNFTINSEVIRFIPGTVYRWEFKSNDSEATFITENGQPNMTINPGNKNGAFNLKLTVINPPNSSGVRKVCSCTKSVSIGNL